MNKSAVAGDAFQREVGFVQQMFHPRQLHGADFRLRRMFEVLTEAALSFLGVGVIPPETTFGAMLANSVSYMNVVPTYLFIPGTVLIILVVSFNLVGDALRDALDPRSMH